MATNNTVNNLNPDSISEDVVEKLCISIQKLTKENNHTEAVKIACGFFGYEDLHAVLCEIENQHIKAGCLSFQLQAIREKIFERLLKNLYSDYSGSIYKKIKNSY